MKLSQKLLILDVDGTLVARNGALSEKNKAALNLARDSGLILTFATGRPPYSRLIQELASDLQIVAPLVTLNGSYVSTLAGEMLFHAALSGNDMAFLHHLLEDHKLHWTGFTKEHRFDNGTFEPITPPEITYLKVVIFVPDAKLKNIVRAKLLRYGHVAVSSSDSDNIEVNPKGVNKAVGLELVRRHLGIERREVIAIGDGLNDLEMLRWAGVSIAMANSPGPVQSAAQHVTDSVERDGVATAVRNILADKSPRCSY